MVTFVTTNPGKVQEAREYLGRVEQVEFDYLEPQTDDVREVAAYGARAAYNHLDEPVIVDDTALTIEAFDGFPGPYASYVYDTLGPERVASLALEEETRSAAFRGVIAYCDGEPFEATPEPVDDGRRGQDLAATDREGATVDDQVDGGAVPVKLFEGVVPGRIVEPRGEGGFGYDPIFEYDGKTFAEMDTEEKNAISHRGRALARFADWYAQAER